MDEAVRRELQRKWPVSRQAMSQKAKRLKEDFGPMTTDEAMYLIAHQRGVDLAKHLPPETVVNIRHLFDRVNDLDKSQSYLAALRESASRAEMRRQIQRKPAARKAKGRENRQSLPIQSWDFIENADLRVMLARDYSELGELLNVDAPKSALVLCGSMLEAILVSILRPDEAGARKKYAELFPDRQNPTRAAPPLEDWKLHRLISVGSALGKLDDDSQRIASAIKDYRNLIHPMVEIRRQANITEPNIVNAVLSLFKHILLIISMKKRRESSPV